MDTLDSLKKKLDTSKSVKKVVSTMKSLAAANIKKYEKAVLSLEKYKENIDLGLQAILSSEQSDDFLEKSKYILPNNGTSKNPKKIAVLFGSNQGLCGRFNDRVIEFFYEELKQERREDYIIISVGNRLDMLLDGKNLKSDHSIPIALSLEAIVEVVYDLLNLVDAIRKKGCTDSSTLYYTHFDSTVSGTVIKQQLLPLDKSDFQEISKRKWETNNIPMWKVNTDIILKDLLRQYLFTMLYSTITNSVASEMKNRMMTLDNAEKNIEDIVANTSLIYNQKRQGVITSELLDVVSGAQVAKRKKKKS